MPASVDVPGSSIPVGAYRVKYLCGVSVIIAEVLNLRDLTGYYKIYLQVILTRIELLAHPPLESNSSRINNRLLSASCAFQK